MYKKLRFLTGFPCNVPSFFIKRQDTIGYGGLRELTYSTSVLKSSVKIISGFEIANQSVRLSLRALIMPRSLALHQLVLWSSASKEKSRPNFCWFLRESTEPSSEPWSMKTSLHS